MARNCHRRVAFHIDDPVMLREPIDMLWVESLPAARRSRRIAVVTETYPPEVNGVAMSMARIVDGLHRRHHDLQLIRPRQRGAPPAQRGARFDEFLTPGWPVPLYPGLRMGVPSKRALVKLWSHERPDVVHIATEGPLGWSALQAAHHLELPVTSDYRTNFHAYGRHYKAGWLSRPILGYLRKFHNRCRFTMVPTEALRSQLVACGFERLRVVGRGVDTGLFDPARRREELRAGWAVLPSELVLAYVGRLAAEKNLDVVVRCYEAVRERRRDVQLLFVGDGPMRAELEARCPDAIFAGSRHGEDLAAHYACADLFVFPSLTETFGNVTTEAMASGLPVVAFDRAAAGQLIRSGENGVLVPGTDAEAFTKAVCELATDDARRLAMGPAARATACGLGWDDVVQRFESVLDAAIEGAPVSDRAPALPLQGRRPA
jgi:glycosyltransferase involved in cell wall biosynthesis